MNTLKSYSLTQLLGQCLVFRQHSSFASNYFFIPPVHYKSTRGSSAHFLCKPDGFIFRFKLLTYPFCPRFVYNPIAFVRAHMYSLNYRSNTSSCKSPSPG